MSDAEPAPRDMARVDVGVEVRPDRPLTEKQLALLVEADRRGYFAPETRETTLIELGEYFNTHPDALSIQLRRARRKVLRGYCSNFADVEVSPWRDPDDADEAAEADDDAEPVGPLGAIAEEVGEVVVDEGGDPRGDAR